MKFSEGGDRLFKEIIADGFACGFVAAALGKAGLEQATEEEIIAHKESIKPIAEAFAEDMAERLGKGE